MTRTGEDFATVFSCALGVVMCLGAAYVVTAELRELLDKMRDKGVPHDRARA